MPSNALSENTPVTYEYCDFSKTVERLWYLLDTVGSTLKMNQSEYMKGSQHAPHGIHGADLLELLEVKGPEKLTSIRYVNLKQAWSFLTKDQSTVLFCKNFGQAIAPAPGQLCGEWSKVPDQRNILAMTGQAIHYFLRKNGSGLSKELKWLVKPPPIQDHRHAQHPSIVHTQLLRSKIDAVRERLRDKLSRTHAVKDLTHSQLIEAINAQSCLLFVEQQGKECTHATLDIESEEAFPPKNSTENPSLCKGRIQVRNRPLEPQNQASKLAPLVGDEKGTIQPAMNLLSESPASDEAVQKVLEVTGQWHPKRDHSSKRQSSKTIPESGHRGNAVASFGSR